MKDLNETVADLNQTVTTMTGPSTGGYFEQF